ncbi:hypothetical protein CVS40_12951 [Lucilia cuprina]|nr:hypothetical protein CVS40_12951 [Lucilia cuprina]
MDLKSIPDLKVCGNKTKNWEIFLRDFDDYLIAKNTKLSDSIKLAILRNQIGAEGKEIIRTLDISVEDSNNYAKVIKALSDYFTSMTNILYEEFVFYNRNQKPNEPIDDFVRDLKELSSSCEFGNVSEMVRDRIVLGIADTKLEEKLLKMDDIGIEAIILECRIYEKQKQQIKEVQEAKKHVDVIQGNNEIVGEVENLDFINKQTKGKFRNSQNKKFSNGNIKCTRCFKFHKLNNCPAIGKTCNKCKKLNHFSIACRSNIHVNTVNQNDSDSSNSNCDFALTDSINSNKIKDVWYHDIMDIFEGVGRFDKEYDIEINQNATPVAHPPRRVPMKIRNKLKDKLNEMVEMNIIEKTDKPQAWVSNLVIREKKDGSLRLCLDPRELNKEIGSSRLQRLMLKMFPYNVEVIHRPGKSIVAADYFSRNYIDTGNMEHERGVTEMIHTVNVTDDTLEKIGKATQNDERLCLIRKYCLEGWPLKDKTPDYIKEYFNKRNDITIDVLRFLEL